MFINKPNLGLYSNLILILVIIVLCNSSCAKTMQVHNIPNFQVQLPTTKIYVFRPSLGAYAININIYENNNLTGHIGARGYIGWETKPGTIVLEANGGDFRQKH